MRLLNPVFHTYARGRPPRALAIASPSPCIPRRRRRTKQAEPEPPNASSRRSRPPPGPPLHLHTIPPLPLPPGAPSCADMGKEVKKRGVQKLLKSVFKRGGGCFHRRRQRGRGVCGGGAGPEPVFVVVGRREQPEGGTQGRTRRRRGQLRRRRPFQPRQLRTRRCLLSLYPSSPKMNYTNNINEQFAQICNL